MRKIYPFLFVAGLLISVVVASYQGSPGYMDADYYYAGGLRISQGLGWSEPYLWNYLDDPQVLPHPAFTYWMPLASLLASVGLRFAPDLGYAAARVGFILAAALIPPLTASVAMALTQKRTLAVASGLLAVFSGFYAPFLPATDTFGLYMLGGAVFLLLSWRWYEERYSWYALPIGLLAGLMHLARADGLLWLALFVLLSIFVYRNDKSRIFLPLSLGILAYTLVMAPWFARNLAEFGTLMSQGSGRSLWLTEYNRLFAYPASQINMTTWLQAGWGSIFEARWWALKLNLQSLLGVQFGIYLAPFVLIGIWKLRQNFIVKLGLVAWGLIFTAMTFVFPFAGARGGFFHSGAALQSLWWALAPVGLDVVTAWAAERIPSWTVERAQGGFRVILIFLAVFLTSILVVVRVVVPGWDATAQIYREAEDLIISYGAAPSEPVIVDNPPGYFIHTNRPALALPDEDPVALFLLKQKFGARFVVLTEGNIPAGLVPLFKNPSLVQGITFLGDVDGTKIFEIP